jgi:hypothetical protein
MRGDRVTDRTSLPGMATGDHASYGPDERGVDVGVLDEGGEELVGHADLAAAGLAATALLTGIPWRSRRCAVTDRASARHNRPRNAAHAKSGDPGEISGGRGHR